MKVHQQATVATSSVRITRFATVKLLKGFHFEADGYISGRGALLP
jgi:hypothetical protein